LQLPGQPQGPTPPYSTCHDFVGELPKKAERSDGQCVGARFIAPAGPGGANAAQFANRICQGQVFWSVPIVSVGASGVWGGWVGLYGTLSGGQVCPPSLSATFTHPVVNHTGLRGRPYAKRLRPTCAKRLRPTARGLSAMGHVSKAHPAYPHHPRPYGSGSFTGGSPPKKPTRESPTLPRLPLPYYGFASPAPLCVKPPIIRRTCQIG
jgi:hypothetical protein